MRQKIQTYVFVAVITVLIWLYAESSTLQKRTIYPGIEFVAPVGRELFIEPKRPAKSVSVQIKGPVSQLDHLDGLIDPGPITFALPDNPDSADPRQKVDLRKELTAYLAENTPGITVIDVDPEESVVRVERYQTRTLPIGVRTDGEVQFTGAPLLDPSEATIKLPASLVQWLRDDSQIIARLTSDMLARSEVGQESIETVPLAAPFEGKSITITPKNAVVTFTIDEKTRKITLKPIPIRLEKPLSADGVYEVIRLDGAQGEYLPSIEVEGPTEIIDRIYKDELKVDAVLSLTNEQLADAVGKEVDGVLTMRTPPGVTVVTPISPIKYKVIKVSRAAAGVDRPTGGE